MQVSYPYRILCSELTIVNILIKTVNTNDYLLNGIYKWYIVKHEILMFIWNDSLITLRHFLFESEFISICLIKLYGCLNFFYFYQSRDSYKVMFKKRLYLRDIWFDQYCIGRHHVVHRDSNTLYCICMCFLIQKFVRNRLKN